MGGMGYWICRETMGLQDGGCRTIGNRSTTNVPVSANRQEPRNICKCSELCADLFTEDPPSGDQRLGVSRGHVDHRRYN